MPEISVHEREFIEFKAVQEERYKNIDRRLLDIRDEIRNQERDSDAQSALYVELNNRVTTIETELKSARRFIATLVIIGSAVSTTVATLLAAYIM